MKVYRQVIFAIIGINIVILFGAWGYMYFENTSFFNALWLTIISVLTVGYGDVVPTTKGSKLFAIIIIPLGIALVTYGLGAFAASLIEGKFSRTVWRKRMERKVKRLNNHTILCGLGRVGQQVLSLLLEKKIPVVVIERNKEALEIVPEGICVVEGDATEDETLYRAGIDRANGLVATLPLDADNVLISLTAKGINENMNIVARAEKLETEEKLRRAGADQVINPSSIGGRRMAMSIIKPTSMEYLDTLLQEKDDHLSVEELFILEGSKFANKTLRESRIRESYGVTIVGIKRENHIISNPHADELLLANDLVILFGPKCQLDQFGRDSQ